MTSDQPAWVRFAQDFGAPMQALRSATDRTGVGAEAFLAIATDLRAIRALLDLALRTNTITGYSMGHPPVVSPNGTVLDIEEVWDGKHASYRKTMPNLSVPNESVTP